MLFYIISLLYLRPSLCAPSLGRIAYPTLIESRHEAGEKLLRIHEGLTLRLEKSSIVADNLLVKFYDGDREISTMLNGKQLEDNLYHNLENMSSLIVTQKGNSLQVEGILNPKLRIRPSLGAERSSDGQVPHTIFEVEKPALDDISVPFEKELSNSLSVVPGKGIEERALPAKFILEVCIVTDKVHREKFKTLQAQVNYMVILVNSASLWYRKMRGPAISLKLVGVVTAKDSEILQRVGDYLDVSGTLSKFQQYSWKSNLGKEADVLVLVTGGDLARCGSSHCTSTSTAGYSPIGAVCSRSNVALVEDQPTTFTGDNTFAHELGHQMGAYHDGDSAVNDVSGKREAELCSSNDGYLMSAVGGGAKYHHLSVCTVRQITLYISTLRRHCLELTSKSNISKSSKRLPGDALSQEKYCKKMDPDHKNVYVKKNDHRNQNCQISCCYDSTYGGETWISCSFHPIPNGMKCGVNKTCIGGVCGIHKS